MVIIALGVLFWQASESRRDAGARIVRRPLQVPAERYQLLARFEPPPYLAGDASAKRSLFLAAMERYSQRDYAGAIPRLRAAIGHQPDFLEARYYLGICLLLANDHASGVKELEHVVAAGDTRYLENARFYLAKGLLAGGDVRGAQQQLENVVALHGKLEKQAQALLAQITAL
jgi:TolA-binding protein